MRKVLSGLALAVGCWTVAVAEDLGGVSAQDQASAAAVTLAYRDAWLRNAPEAVMATLTPDTVLLPSGLEPISGEAAIRRFWWPDDRPLARVTAMEQVIDEIMGDGSVAIVRGHGSVSYWMMQNGREEKRDQRSTFMNIVRRQANGAWLIAWRMWSDLK
jgi:ketosteroid isomerase-like protein